VRSGLGLKESLVLRVAKHWISGTTLDEVIADARAANQKGLGVVINYLGEEIKDLAIADAHLHEYMRVQAKLAENSINGFASVKLTQLGLSVSSTEAEKRLLTLAEDASRKRLLLWLDMESSKYHDQTLDIYKRVLENYDNVGVALQAYMRRAESDLTNLLRHVPRIRVVKGAYREPADVVFTSKEEIRENYIKLMKLLFDRATNFALGTHDSKLIYTARDLAKTHNVNFEFEMLKGIRDELKLELAKSGYRVSDYLPYGDLWYNYSIRRIREHPSNVWLLLRSLF
jgi:proline dehydrogenase